MADRLNSRSTSDNAQPHPAHLSHGAEQVSQTAVSNASEPITMPAANRRRPWLIRALLAGLVVTALVAGGLIATTHLGADDTDLSWFVLPDLIDEPTQAWSITAPGAGDLIQVLAQDGDHVLTHRSSGEFEGAINTIALIDTGKGKTVWQREITGPGGTVWVVGVTRGGHLVLEVAGPPEATPVSSDAIVLDAGTGATLSHRELTRSVSVPIPGGPIFIIDGNVVERFDGTDLSATPTWQAEPGGSVRWPSLDSSGRFLTLSAGGDGQLTLDAATGQPPTNIQVDSDAEDTEGSTGTDGWFHALGDTIVHVASVDRERQLTVLEPDGSIRWQARGDSFEVLRIADDALGIFRVTHVEPDGGSIERLDPLTGESMWGPPVPTDGTHIATAATLRSIQMHDGRMPAQSVLLNLEDGTVAGMIDHDGVPWYTLTGGESIYYGIDGAGTLHAWDHDATPLWSLPTQSDSIVRTPNLLLTSHRTDGTVTAWR